VKHFHSQISNLNSR